MVLSWNEIKGRALAFSKEWAEEQSEDAEAKSFWDDFFNVFGISRRRVATFEQQVRKLDNKQGFIDLLWKGKILVEHKSRGRDLDRAYQQAKDYFPGLKEQELPRYILVSDFARFRLYDLEDHQQHEFLLEDLVSNVHLFDFIAGYEKRSFKEQDPVNVEAAELMGKLHDKLKDIGYDGHQLELYLVRLLFCLFADDTNIWERDIFHEYLDNRTSVDGSDLAAQIAQIFQVLNTPEQQRFKNLDESLAAFPYVNGKLFEEQLPLAHFDSTMRQILLDCCLLDWGRISPAIFGSLFQSVMDEKARRNLGAHYTSEKNILKLIKPLFMDDLWAEFEKVKSEKGKLKKLHEKISKLRFLDPACGCGNFLIIAYRELRLLELEIVKAEFKGQLITNINEYFLVDVSQFYGIEYEEFPCQIAQVAMWLIDHQMNEQASRQFGEYFRRIPLRKSATIRHGNALRIDWQSLIDPMPWEKEEPRFHYILGNPPFVGKQMQDKDQKADMDFIFTGVSSYGALDYVCAWYLRAAKYLQEYNPSPSIDTPLTRVSFVSTNSITQGEQVAILWGELFNRYKIKIHFAHRTFKWGNEARGNAAVHVVIIGFSNFDVVDKWIYEYEEVQGEPHTSKVKNVNPYLVGGEDILIDRKSKAICDVPEIRFGNQPIDGGFLILDKSQFLEFAKNEPDSLKVIRRFYGSDEFINNIERYCLWLRDANPSELRKWPMVLDRLEKVRQFRLQSVRKETRDLAATPSQFAFVSHLENDYVIIPSVSSERRKYIPIGFMPKDVIASNLCLIIPGADRFHFGILQSLMHMTWTKTVCGRLKSDIRYSNGIVYNNFPWPENPSDKQKQAVEQAAQSVLNARSQFPDSSLADLYDPNTMPPVLVKAHQALNRAVDLCYRSQAFTSDSKRMEFLFELYDKYTAGLFAKEKKVRKK